MTEATPSVPGNQEPVKKSLAFLPQVDGLRFVAVFGVMMHHWAAVYFDSSVFLHSIPFGTGVNLFYVISGFLITYILLGKKEDISNNHTSFGREIKNFYVKRTLRIFPIYYLLIIILLIAGYHELKGTLAYLLTYTSNWYMVFKNTYMGGLTHTWSLAVEEQFYLIWPFCILLVPRRRILLMIFVFIAIALISKIYFWFYTPYPMGTNGATFSCFDSLGLGALIAYNQYNKIIPFKLKYARIFLWSSMLVYGVIFIYPILLNPAWYSVFMNTGTSIVYFFVVYIAANNGFTGTTKGFLENRVVLYLGRISYGLYLYHNLMAVLFWEGGMSGWFPQLKTPFDIIMLYTIVLLIVSTISWYLIEQPILRLKKRFE